MRRSAINNAWRGLLLPALLFAAGCGQHFTFFPERHTLCEEARAIAQCSPIPDGIARELEKQVLPAYIVEPGDVLLVTATDLDAPVRLPGDQPVLADGTIALGKFGRPVVAGRSVEEIEDIVRSLVKTAAGEPVPITVRLVSRQSKVFYVLGEVNAPGAFPLAGRECVLDGIIAAGGLNDRASRRDIILSRPTRPGDCRIVLPVKYCDIVQLGDTTTNYQLAPGDRIFVASKGSWEDCRRGAKDECGACKK